MLGRNPIILMVLVTIVVAAAVSSSSAGRLEISNFERGFSIVGVVIPTTGSTLISCPLTLAGSFSTRTFAKRAGGRIGGIENATLGTCTEGAATILGTGLPWEVQYDSFVGSLPTITDVKLRIIGLAMSVENTNIPRCLIRSTATEPYKVIGTVRSGTIGEIIGDTNTGIAMTGPFLCAFLERARVALGAAVTVRGETALPQLRLI